MSELQILTGDCRETLKTLPDASVQCCVTSPPYWGLRDYGHEGQIGQEKTPEEYVAKLVAVFSEVHRVLKPDGTLWVNLGDSYSAHPGQRKDSDAAGAKQQSKRGSTACPSRSVSGLKPKDLVGIPWIVAFALRAAGWWLRQDIIWSKPNPMPESVTDRCTKAHEYIFLLTKSERYYFDSDAIAEPVAESSISRLSQDIKNQHGSDRVPGKTNGTMKAVGRGGRNAFRGQGHFRDGDNGPANREGRDMKDVGAGDTRNKRSVWTVTTKPFKGAHFATFPTDLITPCILAGSKSGDTILDPFGGSGTTGQVALELGRSAVLCELNPEYVKLIERRTDVTPGLAL